ncbi:hypothetical protein [Devosia sp.]|uniref:hypothetical protein n=1 Tax=Devosia sp. TaxID=1871048 RepID=UPI001ACE4CE4|nr:hypothetical protein [Devosia sp.]MBN9335763.1 hypothetical protein [Devosia sp.]
MRRLLLAWAILAGTTAAVSADPGVPKADQSGKGTVLCLWPIYVGIQQGIELCDLPQWRAMKTWRRP